MSEQKDLLSGFLNMGMSVVQKVMSNPMTGPLVMKAFEQALEVKASLEEQRDKLLESISIASAHEQEELKRNLTTIEKKLERLERRLKETQQRAKEAEKKIAEYEAAAAKLKEESAEVGGEALSEEVANSVSEEPSVESSEEKKG